MSSFSQGYEIRRNQIGLKFGDCAVRFLGLKCNDHLGLLSDKSNLSRSPEHEVQRN